jgi:hypothetical protein
MKADCCCSPKPCPRCGYCPTCGRGDPYFVPYQPGYPYPPYPPYPQPVWIGEPAWFDYTQPSTTGMPLPLPSVVVTY